MFLKRSSVINSIYSGQLQFSYTSYKHSSILQTIVNYNIFFINIFASPSETNRQSGFQKSVTSAESFVAVSFSCFSGRFFAAGFVATVDVGALVAAVVRVPEKVQPRCGLNVIKLFTAVIYGFS
jgi:hypothetical protein